MNPIIEKQLKKCKVAEIPSISADTTYLVIKKSTSMNKQSCIPGHYYEIKLADYLVHPPEGYSFFINWNAGRVPKHQYYRCEVQQVMGKMVQVNGASFSPDGAEDGIEAWSGWLPLEGVEIIKEF